MGKKRIIAFVKNEIKGKVKTRLAQSIGDDDALEVYRQLLCITRDQLNKVTDVKKEVWYAWNIPDNDLWDEGEFEKRLQVDGNLGNKMMNAFSVAFEEGADRVIIIGSDCPGLTDAILNNAFEALETSDLVFGPSEDGGYYLIGMSRYSPEVLENIEWSTERVMKQTEERAKKLSRSLKKLEQLYDIDTGKDWIRFKNERDYS